MTDRLELSTVPSDEWLWTSREHQDTFHSLEWQHLLREAFGTQTVYVWDTIRKGGFAVPVFSAGPFRVGYVGFPVGGAMGGVTVSAMQMTSLMETRFPIPCHLLQWPISAFLQNHTFPLPSAKTLETAVTNLSDWELSKLKSNSRRDIRKSQRTGLILVEAAVPTQGDLLYAMYRETIMRHDGMLRYNNHYFRLLVELAQEQPRLRCLIAKYEDEVAGFVVVALSGNIAYYLHAAIKMELRKHLPSEFLLYEAIQWAKDEGAQLFSLMSSPVDQPSLVRYKEKWGGETREHHTYELSVRPTIAQAYHLVRNVYNHVGSNRLTQRLNLLLTQR